MRHVGNMGKGAWRACAPGWSLLELMVVLVIIGLLAGLVGPRVLAFLERGEVSAGRAASEESRAGALDLSDGCGPLPNH